MSVSPYVEGQFTAMHAPFGSAPHGHDWFVRATFPGSDSTRHYAEYQRDLDGLLATLDHGDLHRILNGRDTNEGVAAWIGERLSCTEVDVWRFEKNRRFGAVWRAHDR